MIKIINDLLCQRFPLGTPVYLLYDSIHYHDIPNIFFEDCDSHNSTPFHKQKSLWHMLWDILILRKTLTNITILLWSSCVFDKICNSNINIIMCLTWLPNCADDLCIVWFLETNMIVLKSFNNDDDILFVLTRFLVAHHSKWLERNQSKFMILSQTICQNSNLSCWSFSIKFPISCLFVSIQRWPYNYHSFIKWHILILKKISFWFMGLQFRSMYLIFFYITKRHMGMSFMITEPTFQRTLLNMFEKNVLHNFWLFVRKLDSIR